MKNQKDINRKNIKLYLLVTAMQGVAQVNLFLKKKKKKKSIINGYSKVRNQQIY